MKIRLGSEDRVWWAGIACEVVRSSATGHVLRTVGSHHEHSEISDAAFSKGHDDGTFVVERDYFKLVTSYGRRGPPVSERLADLTEEQVDETMYRLEFVTRFEELKAAGATVKTEEGYADAAVRINEERRVAALAELKAKGGRAPRGARVPSDRAAPSGAQMRRWCEAYAASGVGGLSPRTDRCGNRKPRLDDVVIAMIERTTRNYCSLNRPSIQAIHDRLARHIRIWNRRENTDFAVPSYGTVRTRVLNLPFVDREVGRETMGHAQRSLAVARGGPKPRLLLERIEIDEWDVQLQTLLVEARVWRHLRAEQRKALAPMRCWLSAAICCTSNVLVGLDIRLDEPSHRSSIATLRSILMDKTALARVCGARTDWAFYGTPTGVFTDQGAAFKSLRFKRVYADLRCTRASPPGGFPHLRKTVERFFRTLDTGLMSFFTGRTFSSSAERGDYDAQHLASLTVEELRRAVIRFVCDVYHRRKQVGLGNRSPVQVWEREMARTRVLPPPPKEALRDIFGVEFVRTIQKYGIRFGGVHFHSAWVDDFWLQRGSVPVDIRVDPESLSAISVKIGPAKWVSVNAVDGNEVSAAELLAALKFDKARPKSEFDDEVENQRVIDEALADLEELGETARINAGVPNPVVVPEAVAALRRRHKNLWEARDAKAASKGLDHLAGAKPKASRKTRSGLEPKTTASPKVVRPSARDAVARGATNTAPPVIEEGTKPVRDPTKPRFTTMN